MVLFLFAISFTHFGSEQGHQAWSKEIALHHAGIPLALFVLFRIIVSFAGRFLRFVVNASLAAAAVLASIRSWNRRIMAGWTIPLTRAFSLGRVPAANVVRLHSQSVQSWLTSVVFLRSMLRRAGRASKLVRAIEAGGRRIIFLARRRSDCEVRADRAIRIVRSRSRRRQAAWVQAVVPLRFSRGDARYLVLGPRDGAGAI